jgi:DNA-binding transcriptional LysR family regulator
MRTLTNLDLRLIRIFRAIVECQGLSNAELVLHLSQSRISAGLAELEARLGVRLCQRGRAGFSLTEGGTTVYEASHDLFEAADRFCNQIGAVSSNLQHVLRLGTVDAVATNRDLWLATALRRLREKIPTLIIDFSTSSPGELEKQLETGSRDIIVMPAFHKRKGLSYQKILHEKHSLYCARGHRLFEKKDSEIGRDDLGKASFIARGYLHDYDLQRVGHGTAEATVETMEAQLVLILTGDYIGYLPTHYAGPWIKTGALHCMKDSQLSYNSTLYAVTQPSGSENRMLRHLLSIIAHIQEDSSQPRETGKTRVH